MKPTIIPLYALNYKLFIQKVRGLKHSKAPLHDISMRAGIDIRSQIYSIIGLKMLIYCYFTVIFCLFCFPGSEALSDVNNV